MKHFAKKAVLAMLLLCVCLGPVLGGVNTMEVSAASQVQKGWVTKGSKKYYYGEDGKYKTGWYTIKNKSYFFNSKGVLQPKKTKPISKKLVKAMDKAIKKLKITADTDEKTALKLLFDYVSEFGYMRYQFTGAKGWEYDCAETMLTQKQGSCFHYAAAFAFLAKRVTGYPVRVGWGEARLFKGSNWQQHAWAEIKIGGTWYLFDPIGAHNVNHPNGISTPIRPNSLDWYMQKRTKMVGARKYYKSAKYVNVEI